MAEEGTQVLPFVRETVLKKRKVNEDWAIKNRERKAIKRQRRRADAKGAIKRPEEFVAEFRNKELDFLRMRTRLKVRRLRPAETIDAKLLFAIRIPGTTDLHPDIRKILARLRLTQVLTGVFLRATEANLKRLAAVGPFVTYGRGSWISSVSFMMGRNPTLVPSWHVWVEKLAEYGAKMVIISNSSRRSSVTMEKLKSLGFDTSCFLGAITSEELTHQYLQKRDDPWFAALGRKCIHLTWGSRGAISLEGLGLQVVSSVDDAEFILAHGTSPLGDPLPKSLEELEQVLILGIEKRLPMVVANPDHVTVEARDQRAMPGTLAAKYESLGGEVKWMGKPDKVIYTSAMSLAGIYAHECIAVGDSLHHDIKGPNVAGIASAFTTGGIHAAELGLGEFGETAGDDAVSALCCEHSSYPSYDLPSFTW